MICKFSKKSLSIIIFDLIVHAIYKICTLPLINILNTLFFVNCTE